MLLQTIAMQMPNKTEVQRTNMLYVTQPKKNLSGSYVIVGYPNS
jgi:hypothetical protein